MQFVLSKIEIVRKTTSLVNSLIFLTIIKLAVILVIVADSRGKLLLSHVFAYTWDSTVLNNSLYYRKIIQVVYSSNVTTQNYKEEKYQLNNDFKFTWSIIKLRNR